MLTSGSFGNTTGTKSTCAYHGATQSSAGTQKTMSGEDFTMLLNVLDTGDLELRFHDGRSIKAHSLKLKIASFSGVLQNLIEDVFDDQITGSKRKRADPGSVDHLPILKVSPLAPMHMQALTMDQ